MDVIEIQLDEGVVKIRKPNRVQAAKLLDVYVKGEQFFEPIAAYIEGSHLGLDNKPVPNVIEGMELWDDVSNLPEIAKQFAEALFTKKKKA